MFEYLTEGSVIIDLGGIRLEVINTRSLNHISPPPLFFSPPFARELFRPFRSSFILRIVAGTAFCRIFRKSGHVCSGMYGCRIFRQRRRQCSNGTSPVCCAAILVRGYALYAFLACILRGICDVARISESRLHYVPGQLY